MFTALVAQAGADEDLNWAVSVDSTTVRAHQHAAGARKKKGGPADEPDDHAIGRSRGGLTTKIHLAADDRCRPLAFSLSSRHSARGRTTSSVPVRSLHPHER